jgi:stage V sporulation protein SpoVS
MSESERPKDIGGRARSQQELRVASSTDRGNLGYAIARFILEGKTVILVGMGDAALSTMVRAILLARGHLAQHDKDITANFSLREKEDPREPSNVVTETVIRLRTQEML